MDDTFGDFTSSENPTSMQGFSGGAGAQAEVDPEADFLAREQAAFAAIALNDALPAATSTVTSPAVTSPSTTQDILFDAPPQQTLSPTSMLSPTSARPRSTSNYSAQGDSRTMSGDVEKRSPLSPSHITNTSMPTSPITPSTKQKSSSVEDTEHAKRWKAKQQERIKALEEASKAKHERILAKAREDIDKFYEEYNRKKERLIAQNREKEQAFTASLPTSPVTSKGQQSTTWDRVASLIETAQPGAVRSDMKSPGGTVHAGRPDATVASAKDLSRFKQILTSLKGQTDVPGVSSKA